MQKEKKEPYVKPKNDHIFLNSWYFYKFIHPI